MYRGNRQSPQTSAAPPAGGAELGQIVIATVAAMFDHRGAALPRLRPPLRPRRSCWSAWPPAPNGAPGIPGWAALPAAIATASLLVALFGMYWDISLHIDNGRDAGPLANPAHYFILVGLFGIFTAGFIAIVLPRAAAEHGRDPRSAATGGRRSAAC